jgi:hypothetical protein
MKTYMGAVENPQTIVNVAQSSAPHRDLTVRLQIGNRLEEEIAAQCAVTELRMGELSYPAWSSWSQPGLHPR